MLTDIQNYLLQGPYTVSYHTTLHSFCHTTWRNLWVHNLNNYPYAISVYARLPTMLHTWYFRIPPSTGTLFCHTGMDFSPGEVRCAFGRPVEVPVWHTVPYHYTSSAAAKPAMRCRLPLKELTRRNDSESWTQTVWRNTCTAPHRNSTWSRSGGCNSQIKGIGYLVMHIRLA